MSHISLPRNLGGAVTPDSLQFQIGELVAKLEDYLNAQINIFVIDSKGPRGKIPLPTLQRGDLVLDLNKVQDVATLQFWDGKKFVTFNLANFVGFINLLTQGNGSGTNPTLFLRSDGADGWTLDTPTRFDTSDILATVDIPAFSLVTENGQIADSANLFHFGHVVGISTVAVLTGFIDTVVVQGEVTNNAWTWTNNDKLFLNGTILSTVPPATGFSQFIAIAKNNNTIFVRLQQPVRL